MKIGIPKEVKDHEYRVGTTPAMVKAFTKAGHEVLIQTHAGSKIGFEDEDYKKAGAKIVSSPEEVYTADMVIKVKEPQPSEYPPSLPHIKTSYLNFSPSDQMLPVARGPSVRDATQLPPTRHK